MSKQDAESKALVKVLIGGIVGISAITVFLALRREKETPLNAIGETIAQMGEILHSHKIEEPAQVKDIGKKLRKNEDTLCEVADWVATGISLWKKLKN